MANTKKKKDEIQGEILHEYDGIEEADNSLPLWWLATLYGAIIFSIGYWFIYHVDRDESGLATDYPTTSEQFAAEYAEIQANAAVEATEEELLALLDDPAAIAAGQETFSGTCAACHGANAEGVIGPNLTDSAWLHGGDALSIYRSARNGITQTEALIEGSAGMPAWGQQLGEEPTRQVSAYVLSLRNTNVEGREAEGEPYVEDAADAAEALEGAAEAVEGAAEAVEGAAEAATEAVEGAAEAAEAATEAAEGAAEAATDAAEGAAEAATEAADGAAEAATQAAEGAAEAATEGAAAAAEAAAE